MTNWKPFNLFFGSNQYFLIRKSGYDPRYTNEKKFVPIVAQFIDGNLYSVDNELEALSWVNFDSEGFCYEEKDPFKANLEWMEIPE